MAGTRSANKRAAPAAEAEPIAPKPRAAKRAKVADDEDTAPKTTKPKAKGKGKTATAEVDSGEEQDTAPPEVTKQKTKAKTKANAGPVDADDEAGDAKPTVKSTKAASKGEGKAKLKADPEDDAEVKAEEAQADGGAIDSATDEKDEIAPKLADAQFAKSKNLLIPVDEGCYLGSYQVHVDSSSGIIFDAALNQTNAGNNNNKFYKIQLLTNGSDFKTWTRWGRVGEGGQNAVLGGGSFQDALSNFEKKFKDKTGLKWDDRGNDPKPKKYIFIEKSYEPDSEEDEEDDGAETKLKPAKAVSRASPPKCTLEPPVKSLMELIFNQQYFEQAMQDLNYDPNKMPLGKLSKATILRGYQALKDLSALFSDPSLAQSKHQTHYNDAVETLSNRYYSYIPHAFGRNKPPVINSQDMLQKEVDLMDNLTDLKDTDQIIKAEEKEVDPVHPLDSRFKGLGMQEMTPVESSTQEFREIEQYLVKTRGSTHSMNYQVRDIFRIERQGEEERFEKSNFAKIKSDRRLLWHGSRATNYGGILSQGLRIAPPEAPVNGYMFGKGVYLADMSSKSANYCMSSMSGREALLLLCDAELGQPMQELQDALSSAGEDALKKGMWSTWGQGTTGPKGWKDAGCVHPSLAGVKMPDTTQAPGKTKIKTNSPYGLGLYYNEYICYDVAQVRLRYLLRVKV